MKRKDIKIVKSGGTVFFILGLIAISCARGPEVPAMKESASSEIKTPESQNTAWQAEWGKWLEASTKERRVLIVTNIGPEVNRAISQRFQEKFGIQAEFLVMRGPEIAMKLQTERRAGLSLTDIVFTGLPPY